jgi:DUF1680 family protein
MSSETISLKQVRIDDAFWTPYVERVRQVVIPYQWEALNDRVPGAEPSHALRNFRIAAGLESGSFGGFVFQDSDVYKWLEAVGYALATRPDPELERKADEAIDLIAAAQQPDGYLNTYFTIREPGKRWTNLTDCHELYCAGHLIEAAVAYHRATGKRKLLDVACRFADHIDATFGPNPGQIRGYDGHQEIELALVKLYEATGEERYLRLAAFFIDERGREPFFFREEWEKRGRTSHWRAGPSGPPDLVYHQSHRPVREQTEAVGHAVRAVYMYTAMADLARRLGDESLQSACRTLWRSIVSRRMYITGGIGSTAHGEAFTFDYDLPNDTVYSETCASIGLVFFAQRMLQIEPVREYADIMERALYNAVIAGMSLDGKRYFYVNPLEVWPEASERNPSRAHVKPVRQPWYGCACCPPNLARLIASLGSYIYTVSPADDTIYAHLYIGGEAEIPLSGGPVTLRMVSGLPWDGNVRLTVHPAENRERPFTLALRLPEWCDVAAASLRAGGERLAIEPLLRNGYIRVHRTWRPGDTVELELPMPVRLMEARPEVRANAGKVAITRGPLVYCLEETDNGRPLSAIAIPRDAALVPRRDPEALNGVTFLEGPGYVTGTEGWNGDLLYRPVDAAAARLDRKPVTVRAVPYALWGNREPGEMTVWIRALEI